MIFKSDIFYVIVVSFIFGIAVHYGFYGFASSFALAHTSVLLLMIITRLGRNK